MREIKFRGQRVDTGEWVYGGHVKISDKHYIITDKANVMVVRHITTHEYLHLIIEKGVIEVIPKTIGQYTGISSNDENSTKLYESDIVEFDNSEIGGEKYIGEILWCDDQALDSLAWGLWTKKGYLCTDFLGKIKLLSNIHEKPELMNQ